ncbi:hypothetical protein [Enterovibrio gelatinilyticus]|uniref:hypothetical protein n=1 Tax=Enterovibrio gelatinilyticus TaxID=2899819 RepID=UPI003B66C4C4
MPNETKSDEAVLDAALSAVREQYPEIVELYLPPEANASQMALVTIKKEAVGQGPRVMEGLWTQLGPITDLKFVMVFDEGDVNVRDWNDVIWAITTRMDPARDTLFSCTRSLDTQADSDQEASPVALGGSKMGLDATNKWQGESTREWGTPIAKDPQIVVSVDKMWDKLGI